MKRKASATFIATKVQCPNPHCTKHFSGIRGLRLHHRHNPKCEMAATAALKQASIAFAKASLVRQHTTNPVTTESTITHPLTLINADNADDENLIGLIADDHSTTSIHEPVDVTESPLPSDTETDAEQITKRQSLPVAHTLTDKCTTKLLKILQDANAQHYLYEQVMAWAAESNASDFNFAAAPRKRHQVITDLEKKFNLHPVRPFQIPIKFPEDGLEISVTAYDFVAQLHSLLSDDTLTGDLNDLDVNQNAPFTKYVSPDGLLGPFNSGEWYHNAWDHCCRPDSNDWMCPIIFACDETLVGSHLGRGSVTPLMFTCSIFNETTRNKPTAWRPLGYVYDLSIHGKTLKNTGNPRRPQVHLDAEDKANRYHRILRAILESYVVTQEHGGLHNVPVSLGPYTKHVNVKVPCAMILGDMQGGDKHCGCTVGYSKDLKCLCRKCNVSGNESGNPLVECRRMCMTTIRQYVIDGAKELLNAICQYSVFVAWFAVCFGGCMYGIFSAAMPLEALHALEGGIMKHVMDIFFEQDLQKWGCCHLDIVVKSMCAWERQHYLHSGTNKTMPRTLFKDGVTKLTQINHTYCVGIMLVLVIMTLTDDGKEAMYRGIAQGPTGEKATDKQ